MRLPGSVTCPPAAAGTNAITSCGCPAGYFGKGSNVAIGCGPCPSISTPYVTGVSFDDTSAAPFACSCPRNYYFGITAGGCHRQPVNLLETVLRVTIS